MSQLVRGVVAYKKGDAVTVETVVVPDPGPGEVVVKVQACGVCHTCRACRRGTPWYCFNTHNAAQKNRPSNPKISRGRAHGTGGSVVTVAAEPGTGEAWSGGGFEGDFVAEGFELADVVALACGRG